jgi:hypothetical protein
VERRVDKIRAIKSSNHLFQLKVTDNKGCMNEALIFSKFGNSTACTISPNKITTCAQSNKLSFQLELTSSVNLNTIDRIEYQCVQCLSIQTNNQKDLRPTIEVDNIGSERQFINCQGLPNK